MGQAVDISVAAVVAFVELKFMLIVYLDFGRWYTAKAVESSLRSSIIICAPSCDTFRGRLSVLGKGKTGASANSNEENSKVVN